MSGYTWALQARDDNGEWTDDPDAYGTAFGARHDIDPAHLAERMLETYARTPGQRVAVWAWPRTDTDPITTATHTTDQ